jgi:tol-pal system protein YbgF
MAVCCTSGCGSTERLTRKVSLLEDRVSDLQKSHRDINGRIDELQIQLSLLNRKLVPAKTGGGLSVETPALKVVRLKPAKPSSKPATKKKGKESRPLKLSGPMDEVDPYLVDERLPVDHGAARRSLFQAEMTIHEEQGGEDEEMAARAYSLAAAHYHRSEYRKAIEALKLFVQNRPEHPFTTEALFLIGKSRLALGDVKQAQGDFIVLARKHPRSERAAGALLMAGQCQEKLGWPKEARSTYLQLVESYPLSGEAVEANRRLKALR